jgi:micrococcal nuclease
MKIGILQRLIICFSLCLVFSACSKSGHEPLVKAASVNENRELLGKVVSVYDGDTITVLNSRKEQVKVRFYGIDAPELRQAYGAVAKRALSDLVFQKEVSAEILVPRDKYGRIAAKIFVGDKCVNEEMVRLGLAWWYVDTAKREVGIEQLHNQAKAAKKGLWQDGKPIPPWEYRQLEEEKRVLKRINERKKKEKEAAAAEK